MITKIILIALLSLYVLLIFSFTGDVFFSLFIFIAMFLNYILYCNKYK